MFYFLTKRKNPVQYIDFSPALLSLQEQTGLVKNIEEKNVKLILANLPENEWQGSVFGQYVLKKYAKVRSVFEFTLWKKRT